MRVAPIQTSFNSGEWSPLMYGRVDLDPYKQALATCLNQIPLIQGGVTRRPGTYWASEVKDSTKATRVVGFEYSTTQAYVLELGDLYFRPYRNNGPVFLTAQNITGITQANPGVLTYSGSDTYANGDVVYLSGIVGMTELNGRFVKVANVNTGANTFELTDMGGTNINTTSFTAYSSGGTVEEHYTVTTTYAEADLFQLKFTQSADVLYVAHPSYAPRKITRTAHTSWTISEIDFLDGPYLSINSTSTTLTLSGTSGSVTVTASATTGINGGAGFTDVTDIGRLIRWKDPAGNWTWLEITAWTSTTVVTATIRGANASAGTATVNWRMGLWSGTTGYPGCVTFHEDRLCWGGTGTTTAPQRIDMSKTGDYENMAPTDADGTVASDDAVSVTLNSNDVQVIRWMASDEKGLLVGTTSAEWIVRPSTTTEALSPTNVAAKPSTFYGSANVSPVKAGKAALFAQRAGRKVRELAYVYEVDGFRSPNMTFLAEHVTLSGVKELAYQQEPHSLLWAARNDGVLAGFTYERDQKVLGWHRHMLGGYSNSGHTADALVESVCCIPNSDGTRDEVWLVVKRYINGRTVRYVEYMTKPWERGDTAEDAIHVDCALTYDGSATTSITGAHHLAGETVKIMADGAAHPDKTVSANGVITLDRSASVVQIGYGYNSDGKLLRPEAGAADGTSQGKPQRAHAVTFRFHDTGGIYVGPSFDSTGSKKLNELVFRQSTDETGQAVPLFSGDREVPWNGDWTTENHVCWRNNSVFPHTILAVMPRMNTSDR
jgi:hypothetical protein